ncbi:MAG: DUF4349 domain-containing protein [Planctomycetes bacterium]|nr:DUF4349 domain-containing protein [Planctomycetota bacterium]
MTEENDKQLDEQLAQLTRWDGEKTQLWREALTESEESATSSRFSLKSVLGFRLPAIAAAVIVIAATAATLQFAYGPELVSVAQRISSPSNLRQLGAAQNAYTQVKPQSEQVPGPSEASMAGDWEDTDLSLSRYGVEPAPALMDISSALNLSGGYGGGSGFGFSTGNGDMPGRRSRVGHSQGVVQIADGNELPPINRQVIRKATIELRTDDVRATFLKAAQLISEANSEYTEASSLTGSGDKARANITLRVAVDRLSIVLNQLRKLGKVHSEDMRGEDVTSRVVDLDARLRNEKRIETELLELLEKRDDAPLKEIMDLRSRINEVRQSIEWLTAQKQRLSRLVSLATILVIIRAEDAPEPEEKPEPSLSQYFSDSVGTSWSGGLRFLSDTVAGLLRVIIGGIIWWVVIAVAIYSIMRSRRVAYLPTS